MPKLKVAKIESCQNSKSPKFKVAKFESYQNWKLPKLKITNFESCQSWNWLTLSTHNIKIQNSPDPVAHFVKAKNVYLRIFFKFWPYVRFLFLLWLMSYPKVYYTLYLSPKVSTVKLGNKELFGRPKIVP